MIAERRRSAPVRVVEVGLEALLLAVDDAQLQALLDRLGPDLGAPASALRSAKSAMNACSGS